MRFLDLCASLLSLHQYGVLAFNQEDPRAKPYFDLQYSDKSITFSEAQLLQSKSQYEYKYRILSDGKARYLCSVPNVTLSQDVPTTEERLRLAAETKEESARASIRGQELLAGFKGTCMYWISGYWTYKFCYDDAITQFHALPAIPGTPMFPPRPDTNAGSYNLGKAIKSDKTQGKGVEFQSTGDSKSLVVHYEKGTYCPLIGAERKTEVQFQCSPTTDDRIAAVKEVSSCQYLMVIHTARLCNDVAFSEPSREASNSIVCSRIQEEKSLPWLTNHDDESESSEAVNAQEGIALVEEIAEAKLDDKVDQELSHLSFGNIPEELAKMVQQATDVAEHGATATPLVSTATDFPTKNVDESTSTDKKALALEYANDIADQLEEGTIKVNGQSIFDPKNENVEFDVELQTEEGELLGSVIMKVVDGAVVIDMGENAIDDSSRNTVHEQKVVPAEVPPHVQAVFDRFVGREEL